MQCGVTASQRSADGLEGAIASSLPDPAVSNGDPLPPVVDAVTQIYEPLRHPRGFLRNAVFDGKPN